MEIFKKDLENSSFYNNTEEACLENCIIFFDNKKE